jgi:hypothetical protein
MGEMEVRLRTSSISEIGKKDNILRPRYLYNICFNFYL